jgi:hypothetical protein
MMKLGKAMVALSALVIVSQAAAVFAEESPYATFNIRLEENPVQSQIDPALTQPVTKDKVAFRIQNNTNKAVYFMRGDQKTYIPVVSEATVELPYSTQEYKVVDDAGNTMTSWYMGPYVPAKANVEAASQAEFEQWGQKLQQVIASAQNRTVHYSYQKQEAPYSGSRSERGKMIRGFW